MSHLLVGLMMALIGSAALNASYLIQHMASAGALRIDARHPLRTLRSLLSSRLWVAGGAIGLIGWALSIAALTQAPLSLVQAFLIGGIALLAPIAVRVLGHRLTRSERAGVILAIVALIALTLGRGHVGIHANFHNSALLTYLLLSLATAACLLRLRQRQTQMLALAGGFLYGAADVSIKALTGLAGRHGVAAAVTSPWVIAAAGTSIAAFFCFQRALQSGKPVPVITLMTAGNNLVSIIGGLTVFGDPLGHRPATVLTHVAAFILLVCAAWLLAPTQATAAAEPGSGHGAADGRRPRLREGAPIPGWE